MLDQRRTALSSYTTRLLSEGRIVFSREEAQRVLAINSGALLDAAERLQRRKALISPRRGFYVIVPPQFLAWGAPPPSWYIDDLMRHEGRPYYVGLLKAAELHGASHQAAMEFQVVTDKRLPKIRAGRSAIAFYYRKDITAITAAIEERKTDTGHMKISSLELTMFDLLRYPHGGGGLSNVVTVLSELGARVDPNKLAPLVPAFERSVVQRLGHLLGRLGHRESEGALHEALLRQQRTSFPWVELEPSQAGDPDFESVPTARDERWHVIVRQPPEPDE